MSEDGFDWKPFGEKAWEAINLSDKRINLWDGAVRSGKTVSSIIRWVEYIRSWPKNATFLMCGKTERTLKRNILDEIVNMFGEDACRYKIGSGEAEIFGRTCYVAGANDERSENKIRGLTLYGAYLDEVSLYPENFFNMVISRCSVENSKIFATTNPDHPKHWLKREYIDRADSDELSFARFHFTINDNPALAREYVENLKKFYRGVWYKRYIEGQWCVADGAVYDNFDENKHAVDVGDRKFRYYIVGIDYGITNPTAFVLIGYDNPLTEKYIVKTYYWDSKVKKRKKTDGEFAKDFMQFISGYKIGAIYCDPSAASFIGELKSKYGLKIKEGNNDIVDGIRFVNSEISKDNIYVDKSCQDVIDEFHGYVWDDEASAKHGKDIPKFENDHAMDALRYAMYTHFKHAVKGIIGGFKR